MILKQVSSGSYQYSKDFDYRRYLETKSHFDRVELAVDSGIKDIIASNEKLAEWQIHATEKLGTEIGAGFENLTVSIDAVGRSIDGLRSVCEYGFAQIDLSLSYIDQSIQQLIKIAQTPDQTWALEQYSIAKDAFRKNLIEEALDYVNRAISGHGDRSGYRLEHRFYIMRGLIRLGNYNNFSSETVNLNMASDDFLLAAKYAEHDNRTDCARSFGLAGWTSYCAGRMEDAEAHFRKSIQVNSKDSRSLFELSKVLFHCGNKDEAIQFFSEALRHDFKYGLRAGSDDDFLQYRTNVEECINLYRVEVKKELESFVSEYDQLDLANKQPILTKHRLAIDNEAKSFFEKVKSKFSTAPLADLLAMKEVVGDSLASLRKNLANARRQLRRKAQNLRNKKPSVFDDLFDDGKSLILTFAFFAFYILVAITEFYNGNILEGIKTIFLAVFISVFLFWIIKFIVIPILIFLVNLKTRNKYSSKAAQLDIDLTKL